MPMMFPTHIRRYLDLLYALANRDIRARYRRSFLGPFWAILQPLLLMGVFTGLSSVVDIDSGEIPYVIFSYSVLVPWAFFSAIVTRATPSIIGNASIIKKIRLSREVFPLSAVATSAFDAAMSSLILVGMMIWFGVPLNINILWILPLIGLIGLLGVALGMIFAALGVYWRDVLQINAFFLQLLMYATPIIYPLDQIPADWQWLYRLNPLVGILEGFRRVLAQGQAPDLNLLVWSVLGTTIILGLAVPIFRYMSRYFADVL